MAAALPRPGWGSPAGRPASRVGVCVPVGQLPGRCPLDSVVRPTWGRPGQSQDGLCPSPQPPELSGCQSQTIADASQGPGGGLTGHWPSAAVSWDLQPEAPVCVPGPHSPECAGGGRLLTAWAAPGRWDPPWTGRKRHKLRTCASALLGQGGSGGPVSWPVVTGGPGVCAGAGRPLLAAPEPHQLPTSEESEGPQPGSPTARSPLFPWAGGSHCQPHGAFPVSHNPRSRPGGGQAGGARAVFSPRSEVFCPFPGAQEAFPAGGSQGRAWPRGGQLRGAESGPGRPRTGWGASPLAGG